MGRKYVDISGKTYGKMKVIRITDNKNNSRQFLWELQCECGELCFATSSDLNRGRTHFCKPCRDKLAKLSPVKSLYGSYKRNATKLGRSFELSLEEFQNIISQDCHYCGSPPNQFYKKKEAKEGMWYNGIDRKDNNMGYVTDNVFPCCKFCNWAKKDCPVDEFIEWLNGVVDRGLKNRS